MTQGFRNLLNSDSGKRLTLGIAGLVVALAGWSIFRQLTGNPVNDAINHRIFVCSKTGESFGVTMKEGMTIPVYSPYSKENTGYPAEFCYWTKDGKIRKDPYYVLLKEYKGIQGPTFCPDCGRLVEPYNLVPQPSDQPPPTEAEYKAQRPASN